MPSPGYMWLKDNQGQMIASHVLVKGREGSAEIYAAQHKISIPTDQYSGCLTGARRHDPFIVLKNFCSATPILNKACSSGKNLKEVKISWYRINPQGKEEEYFRQTMSNVKVVAVILRVQDVKDQHNENHGHLEEVHFRYEKIQWLYCDGNIATEDEWNARI